MISTFLAGIRKHWKPLRDVSIYPDYAPAWNNKGLALYVLGRYQEAVDSYAKALSIDPDYVKAWNNKGLALDKLAGTRKRWIPVQKHCQLTLIM